MTDLSNEPEMFKLVEPQIIESTYSIQEIKKKYLRLNKNLVEVLERIQDILMLEEYNDTDKKYIQRRDLNFELYKLHENEIKDHGEELMHSIFEATLKDSLSYAIMFFNNSNNKDWHRKMLSIKTELLKIPDDTTELLGTINKLHITLFKIYDSFDPNYITKQKKTYKYTEFEEDYAFDFNFNLVHNNLKRESNILKIKEKYYEEITEKDLLCLQLNFDPETFKPNVDFKSKCLKAIEIINFQIQNTTTQTDNAAIKPDNSETSVDNLVPEPETPTKNKEFTTKRQVLAIYYMWNELDKNINSIDRTVRARFIQFLTGKNKSNIYKALAEPHKGLENDKNNKSAIKDLEFVKQYFESMGLKSIVEKISNDMQEA